VQAHGGKEETVHTFLGKTVIGKIGKTLAILGGTALLLGVAIAPAFAATTVPFNATYSGSYTPDAANPSLFHLSGAGKATRLGQSTDVGTVAITGPATTCTYGGFAVSDDETFTSTDDGDQVSIHMVDEACQTTPTSNVFHQHGTYTVTGGTGRFVGASGTGTFDCYGDFNSFTFNSSFSGSISQPTG
jgi:hypothetical protein